MGLARLKSRCRLSIASFLKNKIPQLCPRVSTHLCPRAPTQLCPRAPLKKMEFQRVAAVVEEEDEAEAVDERAKL